MRKNWQKGHKFIGHGRPPIVDKIRNYNSSLSLLACAFKPSCQPINKKTSPKANIDAASDNTPPTDSPISEIQQKPSNFDELA